MTAKPIEIFRAGTHIDMYGRQVSLSASDLAAAAAAYDPALHEAPIWIEHRQPATGNKGLIESLKHQGLRLLANPHKVDPAFAESVNAGRFPRVSPCFYQPDSPRNPVPGCYYLKELSLVQIPAVKGMAPPTFAEGDLEEGTIVFADWDDEPYPPPSLPIPLPPAPMPSEEEPKPTPQEIALAEREQRLQAREAELNRRDLSAFLEAQISEGRILPGQKDEWLNLLMAAPGTPIAFGEGTGTAQEALKHLIENLPKIVEFGELAPPIETPAAPSLEEAYKKAGEAYETWRK